MEDDHGDAAGPSTYVRGYHRLPQEDIDMLSTSNWGDQTTPQNQQSPLVPLPPYSPVPGYAPAPQTFRTPQQTSSSVSRGVEHDSYLWSSLKFLWFSFFDNSM